MGVMPTESETSMMLEDQDIDWDKLPEFIIGFEDGDDEEIEEGEDQDEDEEGSDDDEGEDEEEEDDPRDAEIAKLKGALTAERRAHRATRKGKKAKTKETEDAAQAEEDDKVKAAEGKTSKLAARLRQQEIDKVVGQAARKLKFRDEADAISQITLDEDDIEQDEDDPSDVDVDTDAVQAALEKLAKDKPYLIQSDSDDEEEDEGEPRRTSKGVGVRRKGKKGELTKEQLKDLYPALR